MKKIALLFACILVVACQSYEEEASHSPGAQERDYGATTPYDGSVDPYSSSRYTAPKTPLKKRRVHVGSSYVIKGIRYYPKYDGDYSEEGIASWYGPGFHRKKTSNGEIFDQNALTAAHKTLPLPSIVKVTNLNNGRVLKVRVNDRGPFKPGRIIDLSKKAAQTLGIQGIGRVRVDYLPLETERHWAANSYRTNKIKGFKPQTTQFAAKQKKHKKPMIVATKQPMGASRFVPAPAQKTPLPSTPKQSAKQYPVIREHTLAELNLASDHTGSQPATPETTTTQTPVIHQQITDYFVQVGAFASESNAFNLSKRIEDLGNVELVSFFTGQSVLHRVRLGPFASMTQATDLLDILAARGLKDASVVRGS